MKLYPLFIGIGSLIFISCKKEVKLDIRPGDTGKIEIEFDNIAGAEDLKLNQNTYMNGSNETFTITELNYFISNIKLKTTDGTEYTVPKDDSYFLIKEDDESTHVAELENIPAGDYTLFTFSVGVDSLKSVAPLSERTGVLDPAGAASGMYSYQNPTYIFLKMEGTSPASTENDKKISYRVGGFSNLKTITVTAPSGMSARVRKNKPASPEVHLFADAAKILDGVTHVSIATNSIVYFSSVSAEIADNYAGMFSVDHIHND